MTLIIPPLELAKTSAHLKYTFKLVIVNPRERQMDVINAARKRLL
jgi:hypothetical protein